MKGNTVPLPLRSDYFYLKIISGLRIAVFRQIWDDCAIIVVHIITISIDVPIVIDIRGIVTFYHDCQLIFLLHSCSPGSCTYQTCLRTYMSRQSSLKVYFHTFTIFWNFFCISFPQFHHRLHRQKSKFEYYYPIMANINISTLRLIFQYRIRLIGSENEQ